jgi:hypothetical protein
VAGGSFLRGAIGTDLAKMAIIYGDQDLNNLSGTSLQLLRLSP